MRASRRLVAIVSICALVAFGLGIQALAAPSSAAAGRVVVSPEPGSRTASPSTEISFLGVPAAELGTITVTGSSSGVHPGRIEAYSTGTGGSFLPKTPFTPGETVTVRTSLDVVNGSDGSFHFVVATPVAVKGNGAIPRLYDDVPGVEHFLSAPAVTPPKLTVTGRTQGLGSDDLALSPKGDVGAFGPMLTTASGRLVYFRKLYGIEAMDVKVQRYDGKPVLTWWQGKVLDGHGVGEDVIANTSYKIIATVRAGNGLSADLHEFTLTSANTALVTAYDPIRWNLTARGGRTDGTAWDGVVQEIDVKTGLVMFEWHSLDHVPVSDSYMNAPKSEDAPFDWFHVNTIEPLAGDKLLVSGRDTSSIYEVSIADGGKILWTLGGKHSSFSEGPGVSFRFQHDPRLRAHDTVTIFDNEQPPTTSRVLAVKLDLKMMTASLENEWSHDPPVTTDALGDVEPLGNGDTFVSWGTTPEVSLISRSGTQLMNAALPGNDDSYRTFAVHWNATPSYPPAIYAHATGARMLVAASWNGATSVTSWRVLAGSSPGSLRAVATVKDTSFETRVNLARAATVRVEALGAHGRVLSASATIRPAS